MRYALILAGGSGTRLWPMSRNHLPKQLIPFIDGKSLLEIAYGRLEGLVPPEQRFICAGLQHKRLILENIGGFKAEQFLGEPVGRDTVNAVGLGAAVIGKHDPDAVIAVFTADHLIEPIDKFREIIDHGFSVAESSPNTLVTFGIAPTHAATGYGYLELGEPLGQWARVVKEFKEKPVESAAQQYFKAGPEKYLWNSGMFVWRAATVIECLRKFEPSILAGLDRVAEAWGATSQDQVLAEVYPTLRKVSVDFAIMEPASRDKAFRVAAVPMPLDWRDIGSWPMYAETLPKDALGNTVAAKRTVLLDTKQTLVVSNDPKHVVATIGCEDLIIIHTPEATLVCRADRAEEIKKMHALVGEKFGKELL
jgi:mannose-1-phosphate guanylyltransferase